ncbi:MAG TPA: tRNA pseudouridine(38-40) synthase TruA [Treponema sp.]|nr:MAG: tRNA pseudouridine(38-40) synthase TruA [Treponema sp. GWA1_62_8]OHE68137.1 MAG: tRNA pseudouridine(38-40) synthase TruA [Treponema sp. RIFOXYC1_FULL_61_9]OHE70056.1 MAG: tRNA pseudouridine(38-40) synthase TruA [Treponema sp. GWC1_61_84]HCM25386.1 tRNA pseudouridine(38-40) synthase TruA [Treponema sp.]
MENGTFRVLKLVVAYDGSKFNGWQRGNGRTVQGTLEQALLDSLGTASRGAVVRRRPTEGAGEEEIGELAVTGAGRTDAGVHAAGQVASVRVPRTVDPALLLSAVNARLPEDLSVLTCERADDRFHARYRAVAKTYRYRVVDGAVGDPFLSRWSWRVQEQLDDEAMRRAAAAFIGTLDCTSLTADKSKKDKSRTIHSVELSRIPSSFSGSRAALQIDFRGDGFLWNQVRIMAAILVEAGKGAMDADAVRALIAAGDRSLAPAPAPARGLFLLSVEYGDGGG